MTNAHRLVVSMLSMLGILPSYGEAQARWADLMEPIYLIDATPGMVDCRRQAPDSVTLVSKDEPGRTVLLGRQFKVINPPTVADTIRVAVSQARCTRDSGNLALSQLIVRRDDRGLILSFSPSSKGFPFVRAHSSGGLVEFIWTVPAEAQAPGANQLVTAIQRTRECSTTSATPMCLYSVAQGSVATGLARSGPMLSVSGNLTGYQVALVLGCVSVERQSDRVMAFISPSSGNVTSTLDPCLRENFEIPTRNSSSTTAVNPCDRPRPYKGWTNGELSAALVRYMGTGNNEILQGLIDEAACRER